MKNMSSSYGVSSASSSSTHLQATLGLVANIIAKVWARFAVSCGPAFVDRMRWILKDDICRATSEIQRALNTFLLVTCLLGSSAILLSSLNGGRSRSHIELSTSKMAKLIIAPSGVKIKTPQSSSKATTLPWLLELSKFESPLARLDLSFLSNLVVTSPSLDPMPDPAKTPLFDSDRAHLRTHRIDLAHLFKSYQEVTSDDSSLEQ
ncbi:hypothetical protein GH714_034299 [Hevea brasiliensis]|uniref:Uncharacterized protein n=1 Tax=Hevea brasiliensis TaxID=3981 RepID=A0A6A6NKM6_HEVBR|nr:hypothetical protein GH714_034299 [Hevea brasiliensis]